MLRGIDKFFSGRIGLRHAAGVFLFRWWSDAQHGDLVSLAARKHELMLRPLGNVVVLMPPLSIAPSEIDFLAEGVRAAIQEATE